MKNKRFQACFALIALGFSQLVWAQSLSIVSLEWSPFFGSNLTQKGVISDIVKQSFAVKGHDISIEFLPWARAMKQVKTVKSDVLMGAWYSEERAKSFKYSDAILSNRIVFIKNIDDEFNFDTMNSLKNKKIGIIKNYAYSDDFNQSKQFERLAANSLKTNLKKVAAKRLDLTLDDEYVAKDTINRELPHLKNKLNFVKKALVNKPMHITISLQHPNVDQLISDFNDGLMHIKNNGTFAKLLEKHGF